MARKVAGTLRVPLLAVLVQIFLADGRHTECACYEIPAALL